MIIGVRRWALAVGVATVLSAGLGSWAALRVPVQTPPEMEPCHEGAAVLEPGDGPVNCEDNNKIHFIVVGANVLVTCVCPRPQ